MRGKDLIFISIIIILLSSFIFIKIAGLPKYLILFWILLSVIGIAFIIVSDKLGFICFVLFIWPFSYNYFNFEIGIITFNPYVLGILVLFLINVFGIFIRSINYKLDLVNCVLLGVCISFLISNLRASNFIEANFLGFHGLFIPVLSYFVLQTSISDDKSYKYAYFSFLSGICMFAAINIIHFISNPTRIKVLNVTPIGAATLIIVPLIYLIHTQQYKKGLGLLSTLISFISFILTFSRGYFVYFILSFFLKPLFSMRKGFYVFLLSFLLSLFATIFVAAMPQKIAPSDLGGESVGRSYKRIYNVNDWIKSLYFRALYYREGFKNALKKPLLGTGYYKGKRLVVRHNFHVEFFEYGGILGYILYASFLILHFKKFSPFTSNKYILINLLTIQIILLNGLTNSFSIGQIPVTAYVLMGFNEAQANIFHSYSNEI